jgi:hypothetical protein
MQRLGRSGCVRQSVEPFDLQFISWSSSDDDNVGVPV